ncbi:PstS family phosphate ABC transporter substrate-binding protein [Desulfocurvibacter africanus]|uniref:Periplasmic phosphate-binding protein n=1 Tax=Desulfocurvibacter africanus subsp. africanus str. Walvis Bay TaxID=690850 RepID=F3Z2Q5_DESAF|nr:PstS family phosphate ABC transporter substrate-binding protein [Desulfocurvibacter africanus]EGJ50222.1 periplasmic phosphate-binding protein [Desulfocurvibacter africanus subsp. africanus str. Walvis Bay]
MRKLLATGLVALSMLAMGAGVAQARDQIRIVGSSTVYPFASYVTEEFGSTTKFKTPVIESTGSGGGFKLFTEGMGDNTPDITNASRRMKGSEFERAQQNGVGDIVEAIIGFDGIAFAQNKSNQAMNLTLEELTLAVAAEVPQNGKLVPNPYKNWNQINSKLPARPIVVYGPPTSSGTRDAFEELVMEHTSTKGGLKDGYGGKYTKIRQDGVYIDAGENDNLIVQRLAQDKNAFGIFGYSFLEENQDRIQGASINGVEPKPEAISSGKYPISRSLYFYIKKAHIGKVPGIKEYADLFMSEKMIGPKGLLKRIGLIPLPDDMRKKAQKQVVGLVPLKQGDLK